MKLKLNKSLRTNKQFISDKLYITDIPQDLTIKLLILVKDNLKRQMLKDLSILKINTKYKNNDDINNYFTNIEKHIKPNNTSKLFKTKKNIMKQINKSKQNNISNINKKKSKHINFPLFILNITSNVNILIWLLLQYIKGNIPIEDFFNNKLIDYFNIYIKLHKIIIILKNHKVLLKKLKINVEKEILLYDNLFINIIDTKSKNLKINYNSNNSYLYIKDLLTFKPNYENDKICIYTLKKIIDKIYFSANDKWYFSLEEQEELISSYNVNVNNGDLCVIIIKKINKEQIKKLSINKDYNITKFKFNYMRLFDMEFIDNDKRIDLNILYNLYPDIKKYFDSINLKFEIKDEYILTDEKYKIFETIDDSVFKNLKFLMIKNFTKPLNNILNKFVNITTLFIEYNKPLNNSLDKLTKLKSISFDKYNYPLHNSLDNLKNLESIEFTTNYKYPLHTSLDKLKKLSTIFISEKQIKLLPQHILNNDKITIN